jgi:hypothetical protein
MQTASFRAAFAATELTKRKTAFGFTGPEPARLGRPEPSAQVTLYSP